MDKASDYESGDSRFESWQGRFFVIIYSTIYFVSELHLKKYYFVSLLERKKIVSEEAKNFLFSVRIDF